MYCISTSSMWTSNLQLIVIDFEYNTLLAAKIELIAETSKTIKL